MTFGTVLYDITAKQVINGKTVDMLGCKAVSSDQVDDTCQDYRRQFRPAYGDQLVITVQPFVRPSL